jgi:hypothetical protein
MDRENKELAIAGPNVREIEAIICARPFVTPSEARFGEAAVMMIKAQPKKEVGIGMHIGSRS